MSVSPTASENLPNPKVDQLSMDPTALGEVITGLFKMANIPDEQVLLRLQAAIPAYVASPPSHETLRRLLTPLRK